MLRGLARIEEQPYHGRGKGEGKDAHHEDAAEAVGEEHHRRPAALAVADPGEELPYAGGLARRLDAEAQRCCRFVAPAATRAPSITGSGRASPVSTALSSRLTPVSTTPSTGRTSPAGPRRGRRARSLSWSHDLDPGRRHAARRATRGRA